MNALTSSFGRAFSTSPKALASDLRLDGYFTMALFDLDRVAAEFGLRDTLRMEGSLITSPESSLATGRSLTTQTAETGLVSLLAPDQNLNAGEIGFVQFNTQELVDLDSLSFVLLDAVTAGTVIHFTDRTWVSSGSILNSGSFTNAGGDATGVYQMFVGIVVVVAHNARGFYHIVLEPAVFFIGHPILHQEFIHVDANRIAIDKIKGKKAFLVQEISKCKT